MVRTPSIRYEAEFITGLKNNLPLIMALTACIVAFSLMAPTFLGAQNFTIILRQVAILAVVANASAIVLIGGGIDLSLGSILAFSAMTTALTLREFGLNGIPLAIIVGLASGLLAGTVNGLIISRWGLNPLLVTLSTSLGVRGFAHVVSNGRIVSQLPREFTTLMAGDQFGIPTLAIIAGLAGLFVHIVLSNTVYGKAIKGLGSDFTAAAYCGVPVKRYQASTYMLAGTLAAVAGIMAVGRAGSMTPYSYTGIELEAIAACVIGGTQFTGGAGSALGVLLGTLFIGVVRNGLIHVGLETSLLKLVNGSLLVFAVIVDRMRRGEGLRALFRMVRHVSAESRPRLQHRDTRSQ
jgi:ribose/xylose/arabinose/galactoside ABC-type transport system permease subunit